MSHQPRATSLRAPVKRHASRVVLLLSCCLFTLRALAADLPARPGPKGATLVGTVSWRLGNRVAIALAEGVSTQPNEELLVGRNLLLVVLAPSGKLIEAWGEWQPAGRIVLRSPRGPRHWLGAVRQDAPPPGPKAPDAEPAPNIQPGDLVYRAPDARPPEPPPEDPAPKASPK